MFDYVFVLVSIVIGLALTHLMKGVARIVEQPGQVFVGIQGRSHQKRFAAFPVHE